MGGRQALLSMKSEFKFDDHVLYWYNTDEIFRVKSPELTLNEP